MGNREFLLALAIVGAVAWTAHAEDSDGLEARIAALETQVGPPAPSPKLLWERVRDAERRLHRIEVAAGPAVAGSDAAPDPAGGTRLAELQDPRKLREPRRDGVGILFAEWLGAYGRAEVQRVAVEAMEKSHGPGGTRDPVRARDLQLALEDLAALVRECELAQQAYRAATK